MDSDISQYCIKTLSFINLYSDDYEKIITYLLKEIKENDIVYINRSDIWYKFNKINKNWELFDIKILISKMTEFYEFFYYIIIDFIDKNQDLTKTNKNKFKKISKNIAVNIYDRKVNISKIYNYLKTEFSINKNI